MGNAEKSGKMFLFLRLFVWPRISGILVLLLIGGLSNPGPVSAQGPAAAKIPVAASIGPLGDFCRNIGRDRVEVEVLIPPGASPHIFEPPPQAVARALEAKVFVYVGAGLDPWAERLIAVRKDATQVQVKAVAGLPLLAEIPSPNHEESAKTLPSRPRAKVAKEHPPEEGNPHVWLDPVLAQDICRRIAMALIRVDPSQAPLYEANLHRYLGELEALHQEITRRVAAFTVREFVSFHPSFSYFARRYGLREAGVIEVAPGREPTPGHIRKIVEAIRRYKVRVVFAEPQLSPRTAEVIAREAGVKVLLLDPLGGWPPYGNDYLRLMRYNLDIMEQAMK